MQSEHSKRDYVERIVPFTAGDGMPLNLINVRSRRDPTRGPVLLVHGAGVRASLFRPPAETNFVDVLIEHGYDVWLENWRASIEFAPNHWTLDEAAVFDHPAAVRKVVEETGHERIKAVIHCQGSTSFAMSAVAGLVPQVDTIVSNAVSLHPVVPRWSGLKLRFVIPMVAPIMPFMNPHWGVHAPTPMAKLMKWLVKLTHHECHNDVCKLVSFTYGSGYPALWRHENLDAATHDWIREEFGHVPMSFFRQMAKCVRRGRMVADNPDLDGVPADYMSQSPATDARFALLAGECSGCFLPESQKRTHDFLSSARPDYHTLHILPNYSHLDVFIGRHAARDVFPLMIDELDRGGFPRANM